MRRAILFSMDGYRNRRQFNGAVKNDALAFRQIIGENLYGAFHSWLNEDESGAAFRSKLRPLLRKGTARRRTSCLLLRPCRLHCRDGLLPRKY